MAKKKRIPSGAVTPSSQEATSAPAAGSVAMALPSEVSAGDKTVLLLAMMMFFAPALGVPNEEMLQDTLKSAVVSFFALIAAVLFMWNQRHRTEPLRWHVLMGLPVLVSLYAFSSIFWAHNAYLPGVEAIRWFIFGLIVWLGLNTISRERFDTLVLGIHWGAFAAAFWGLMQFWFDMKLFPQGPNPASTFVNRNFGAEFIVTTLPFSIYLLFRSTDKIKVFFTVLTLALNLVYVMACGTRAALIAITLTAIPLCIGLFIYRSSWKLREWTKGQKLIALGIFVYALAGFGSLPSGNESGDLKGLTAIQRTFVRSQSLSPTAVATEESFGMRRTMWSATARMIMDRPLSGVGGGVWEVDQPLYQPPGAGLETDYYAHNEFLQHIAEYGLIGWITIGGAVLYLALSAWRTFRDRHEPDGMDEGFIRMVALCSLFALFVVSNAGFPWRMASTCALFALGLAVVAASDARRGYTGWLTGVKAIPWSAMTSKVLLVAFLLCTVLAAYITQQATLAEQKIVRATKLALGVGQSGQPNHPNFVKTREEINTLIREGVAINPHYRKITPMVADQMAGWGDWPNAVWIWESVLGSRPYIMAIMANVIKGNFILKDYDRAQYWVGKMKALQPQSATARSMEVLLLDHTGRRAEAVQLAHRYLDEGTVDADLAINAFIMGKDVKDYGLAIQGLAWRSKLIPQETSQNHYKTGMLYFGMGDQAKALDSFRLAVQAVPPEVRDQVKALVPTTLQSKL
jgi:O-antigen ligase